MFEYFKKMNEKKQSLQQFFDSQDPIDQQIIHLIQTNELSIDVIFLYDKNNKSYKNS